MLKLLIVEDEELLRMGLVTCMKWEELGYQLIGETGDGRKAIELVAQNPPDVILTDIKMAHMDGLDMAEQLKQDYPDIRIIVISGYDDFDYVRRALRLGAFEYILKPINLDKLKKVLLEVKENIVVSQKKEKQYLTLEKQKAEDVRLLRRELYETIILNCHSIEAVKSFSLRFEEDVSNMYYGVCLLTISHFSLISTEYDYLQILEMDQELEQLTNRVLENHLSADQIEHLTVLRPNKGERLFCISCESNHEAKQQISNIGQIFGSLKSELEYIDVFHGQVSRGLEGLYHSYLNVYKNSEKAYMNNWAEIEGQVDTESMVNFMNYNSEGLFFEIRAGNVEGIEQSLRELQERLSNDKVSSFMQLVLIITNLYYEVIKLPEEVGGTIEDALEDQKKYYQNIISKKRRNDMIEEFGKVCFMVHAYLLQASDSKYNGLIKRIYAYVEEHYSEENLTMKTVAEHAYISVSYLGMIMKKETGKTFIEYLTNIRIEKAKYFLINTDMKNYEIAIACGYSTPAYFSTVFKSLCGITPSEYRQAIRKADDY